MTPRKDIFEGRSRAWARALGLASIAAATSMAACQQPIPTVPSIEVCGGSGSCGGTNNPQASPTPAVSPTPAAGCPVVASVTVGFSGAGGRTSTRVGVGEVLDVTPRAGDRSEIPAACHGQTVQWALSGSAICELTGQTNGFNPHVTCSSPGSFTATATVGAPGGTGATTFTVSP